MIRLNTKQREEKTYFIPCTKEQLNSLYQDFYETKDEMEEGVHFENAFINYINNQGFETEVQIEDWGWEVKHIEEYTEVTKEEAYNSLDYIVAVNKLFENINPILEKSNSNHFIQYNLTDESKTTLCYDFIEWLEEHFFCWQRTQHCTTVGIQQFIADEFEVDELINQYAWEEYQEQYDGLPHTTQTPYTWKLQLN